MDVADDSIDQFLSAVASESVAPAGGTGAAVSGAIGAALAEMACIHLIQNDHTGCNAELSETADELAARRRQLLDLADADAELVEDVFAGDGAVTGPAAKRAVGVPLSVAEACLSVLELTAAVTERGGGGVLVDAVTGAHLARSALDASLFTVRQNRALVADDSFVEATDRRVAEVEAAARSALEETLSPLEDPDGPERAQDA